MKQRIWKIIRRFLLVILIVFLVLLAALLFVRDTLVEFTVEKAGSALLGTQIEVADFSSSLAGRVELTGLTVANPQGYEAPHAIKLEKIIVDIDILSLLTERIRIREITVRGFLLNFEQKLANNNLGEIQDNLRAGKKEQSEIQEKKEDGSANPLFNTVTVRFRDSMKQDRVSLDDLIFFIQKAIKNYKPVVK